MTRRLFLDNIVVQMKSVVSNYAADLLRQYGNKGNPISLPMRDHSQFQQGLHYREMEKAHYKQLEREHELSQQKLREAHDMLREYNKYVKFIRPYINYSTTVAHIEDDEDDDELISSKSAKDERTNHRGSSVSSVHAEESQLGSEGGEADAIPARDGAGGSLDDAPDRAEPNVDRHTSEHDAS